MQIVNSAHRLLGTSCSLWLLFSVWNWTTHAPSEKIERIYILGCGFVSFKCFARQFKVLNEEWVHQINSLLGHHVQCAHEKSHTARTSANIKPKQIILLTKKKKKEMEEKSESNKNQSFLIYGVRSFYVMLFIDMLNMPFLFFSFFLSFPLTNFCVLLLRNAICPLQLDTVLNSEHSASALRGHVRGTFKMARDCLCAYITVYNT